MIAHLHNKKKCVHQHVVYHFYHVYMSLILNHCIDSSNILLQSLVSLSALGTPNCAIITHSVSIVALVVV